MSRNDLLGAHVSTAGGVDHAPARAAKIGANTIQLFTKTPNQWHEPRLSTAVVERFQLAVRQAGIRAVVAHDSYLINLASPDPAIRLRSIASFKSELERCRSLGVEFLVTHPGNFMDDRSAGLERNAAAYAECLADVRGPTILIETTAGSGTALGATFEELALIRRMISAGLRRRVAFCADTCHLYSAGYDLVGDWDGVWSEWDRRLGLGLLRCIHLNDSKTPIGSHRDRHELIAEGSLGPEPFRRVMRDSRFRGIIKIIETPKGGDPIRHDRKMLRRLRAYGRHTLKG